LVGYSTCSRCGAFQYGRRSAFCTRCGAALYERHNFHFARLPRYHNAPRTQSGWQSVPLIVRLAVYAISGMVLLSFGIWLLMVLAIFGSHP
jgi:hypothetical protein